MSTIDVDALPSPVCDSEIASILALPLPEFHMETDINPVMLAAEMERNSADRKGLSSYVHQAEYDTVVVRVCTIAVSEPESRWL